MFSQIRPTQTNIACNLLHHPVTVCIKAEHLLKISFKLICLKPETPCSCLAFSSLNDANTQSFQLNVVTMNSSSIFFFMPGGERLTNLTALCPGGATGLVLKMERMYIVFIWLNPVWVCLLLCQWRLCVLIRSNWCRLTTSSECWAALPLAGWLHTQ